MDSGFLKNYNYIFLGVLVIKILNHMKKTIISFIVFVAIIMNSNAQVFVGGGLGVEFSGGKSKYGGNSSDLPSTFAFSLSPKVGFYLNDDFAIGLEVGFISETEKETVGSTEYKDITTGWGIGAFARYYLLGGDKLSLLLEGSASFGGLKDKTKGGSTTYEGDPMTALGIGVLPVLSYSLTDRLNIEASCDFLRFGFQSMTVKDADNSSNKTTTNNFGFGVNSLGFNALPIGGFSDMIKIGLTFKF